MAIIIWLVGMVASAILLVAGPLSRCDRELVDE